MDFQFDARNIYSILDRPIAFHRVFVDIAGSVSGAVFLSQLVYWSSRGGDADGWIYKTTAEWKDETGITRREFENVRNILKGSLLLEERMEHNPTRIYYRLDINKLANVILCPKKPDVTCDIPDVTCDILYNKESETTTETTTDIISAAQNPHSLFSDELSEPVKSPARVNTRKAKEKHEPSINERIAAGHKKNASNIAWPIYCKVTGLANSLDSIPPPCTWSQYEHVILARLFKACNNDPERFEAACRVYYRYDNEYARKSGFAIGMFQAKWQECITSADRGLRARNAVSATSDGGKDDGSNSTSSQGGDGKPTAASLLQRFKSKGSFG